MVIPMNREGRRKAGIKAQTQGKTLDPIKSRPQIPGAPFTQDDIIRELQGSPCLQFIVKDLRGMAQKIQNQEIQLVFLVNVLQKELGLTQEDLQTRFELFAKENNITLQEVPAEEPPEAQEKTTEEYQNSSDFVGPLQPAEPKVYGCEGSPEQDPQGVA